MPILIYGRDSWVLTKNHMQVVEMTGCDESRRDSNRERGYKNGIANMQFAG